MTRSLAFLGLMVLTPAMLAAADAGSSPLPIAPGAFKPEAASLDQYKYPEWFRDAKLGMWAHWGPQCVPMQGDWYARRMYEEGSKHYKHHLETYGHPSEHGYKDIIPLWKAEKWDPDRLISLYKKAGAKYFVSMGSHHDNFFLWDSKIHKWNAVNMGPKRDVVGDWKKAASKEGLRFGVSEHLGASFTWFQSSHRSDKAGPKAGVPYDGANEKYWDLYHFPADPDDKGWYSKNPKWQRMWYERIKELVDNYQPDLLYTDGGVPFANEVGLSMIAHLYNADAARHAGKVEAVYTCKQKSEGRWVEDLERGVMPGIRPHPWQTDTSIGDWYYNQNWKYRDARWVIQMLVDIVSKNGNLLINVVQRPDGTLDPEAEQILAEMATWIGINGEAIYETRPWLLHGEGPIKAKGGHFKEDFNYTAKDIRFTSKGDSTLYAFMMGWPADGRVTLRSLAKFPDVTGKISRVDLLGGDRNLKFEHNAEGLAVQLPANKPCDHAIALKITGEGLRGFKPELAIPPAEAIAPDAKGNYTLGADDADLHGSLKTEAKGGQSNIGFWDKGGDWAGWKVKFAQGGKFRVTASCSTTHPGAAFVVEVGGKPLQAKPASTGAWEKFSQVDLGTIEVAGGEQIVKVRAADPAAWKAINLRWVKLTRTGE